MTSFWHKIQGKAMEIMIAAMFLNAVVFVLLALDVLPARSVGLRFVAGFFLLVFVLVHGWSRYGYDAMALFFFVTAAIAWGLESLSIQTGFPFGNFHYTDLLGETIGGVPILIFPAYFFNGYLCWTLSGLLFGSLGSGLSRENLVRQPVVAASLMVIWNISFDPIMSTIEGNWIWENGGLYMGVPLSNFAGWLLTTYLIFQTFALLLRKAGIRRRLSIRQETWLLFPVMYLIQGLPSLLSPLSQTADPAICRISAIVTLGGMGLAAAACLAAARRTLAQPAMSPDKTGVGSDLDQPRVDRHDDGAHRHQDGSNRRVQ